MKFSSTLLVLSLAVCAVFASPIESENKRLIKTSEQDPGKWMSADQIIELKKARIGFVDITDDRDFSLNNIAPPSTSAIPTTLRFQEYVKQLISTTDRARSEEFLKEFSAFFNRHSSSEYGEQSQKWLLSLAETALQGFNGNATVREVTHTWRQNSIIARIEGVHPQLKNEVVILGAHEDSLAGGSNSRAPGADDNGSGSTVVLETLRVLAAAGIRPNRTIEFHWYAAEEQGLLGSGAIAREYSSNNVNVVAMLNLDVVGYQPANIRDVGIYTDNGNSDVIQFLRVVTDEYLAFGRRDRACGYGCSDHASWTRNGFPAAMAAEYQWSPYMHTTSDTIETVGMEQVMEFVKLAIGFTVELGEPTN